MILDFFGCIWICLCFYAPYVNTLGFNTLSKAFSGKATHVPKVLLNMCMLDPEEGPCRGGFTMYYFDRSTKSCPTFKWGGCQGNGNRFNTEEECMSGCLSTPNAVIARPKWCSLTFDYGYCYGEIKRWYYDPLWQTCKPRIYSGCGGNENNFYTKEECSNVCIHANGIQKIKSTRKQRDDQEELITDSGNVTTSNEKQEPDNT